MATLRSSAVGPAHFPDLWQAQAVTALRAGADVVVHAPTGAGKTHVFELFLPSVKGQAVFTVPTRALANDKLAEWRARGWDVGIATGDAAENLGARLIVATLETQKGRFLRGDGPRLLAVDEYQMLGDAQRGAAYELVIALAPPETQLLLLSGSVANPQAVVDWLRRRGRRAEVVATHTRPVPLDEADVHSLPAPRDEARMRSAWGRHVQRALLAGLGPVLLFAPRRQAAEDLARELAGALPPPVVPLSLSSAQAALAGEGLAKLLRRRVAWHHSGLPYAVRAGLVEPLAKAGQLRAVVATNGLAAGVNFSLRSVLVTDTRYTVRGGERQLQPEELLQMFGRAGRRGLDDAGTVLVAPGKPRLADARPRHLRRPPEVDWPAMIGVMHHAAGRGDDPLAAAVTLAGGLFSGVAVPLGIEGCLADPVARPCGLRVDAERARLVRSLAAEMLNSRGEWEPRADEKKVPLGELLALAGPSDLSVPWDLYDPWGACGTRGPWRPAIRDAAFWRMHAIGRGALCRLEGGAYGREVALATRLGDGAVRLAPSLRPVLRERWGAEHCPRGWRMSAEGLERHVWPLAPVLCGGGAAVPGLVERAGTIFARCDFSATVFPARRDRHGAALFAPPERRDFPRVCQGCERRPVCEASDPTLTPVLAWRQLGLIEPNGTPTRRGVIFSFFFRGEGLAIAAALEDEVYPIADLVFDLANLRAGHRFAEEGEHAGGARLGWRCLQAYERADHPPYLEMGLPPEYGEGASEWVRARHSGRTLRPEGSELLRAGDIERAETEWRSILRQTVHAPDHPWERWRELQAAARAILGATPAAPPARFPPLLPEQTRPVEIGFGRRIQ